MNQPLLRPLRIRRVARFIVLAPYVNGCTRPAARYFLVASSRLDWPGRQR
jgi:hypothetical protein